MKTQKKKILFYCEDNAARSLFAEAIFRHLASQTWEVYSAGVRSGGPHPLMLRALNEAGVKTSGLISNTLDELPCQSFDLVVTLSEAVGSADLVPINFPMLIQLPFADPTIEDRSVDPSRVFRQVRDQIFGRLNVLNHWLAFQSSSPLSDSFFLFSKAQLTS